MAGKSIFAKKYLNLIYNDFFGVNLHVFGGVDVGVLIAFCLFRVKMFFEIQFHFYLSLSSKDCVANSFLTKNRTVVYILQLSI